MDAATDDAMAPAALKVGHSRASACAARLNSARHPRSRLSLHDVRVTRQIRRNPPTCDGDDGAWRLDGLGCGAQLQLASPAFPGPATPVRIQSHAWNMTQLSR